MEITLQHTDAIYKTFFLMIILLPIPFSIPAIIQLIKCKYEFKEYEFKEYELRDKLLWILPVVVILFIFFTTGLYMMDYALNMTDKETVYVESINRYNGGCYLISEYHKYSVGKKRYPEGNVSDLVEEKVVGHLCEIESYKTSNEVIRIKVLD